jgi:hypothetical protein
VTCPLKPDEVRPLQRAAMPEYVFSAVNELLVEKLRGYSVTLLQSVVADRILAHAAAAGVELTRQQAYDRGYLDFEDAYREAGWDVVYDRPGYNETYEANFTFKRKTK